MAGRIPQGFIDDLLARVNIVDIIDGRVKLKKAGKNYSGLCPFHQEKSPSFSVSPDKQFYYCFGCGAGGNAIGFLMEYERLEFPQAIEEVAKIVGVDVPRDEAQEQRRSEHKAQYHILDEASAYYQRQLKEHPSRDLAVNYLKSRGLTGKVASFFGIGFAPSGWDNLINAVGGTSEKANLLEMSGMLIRHEEKDSLYDRFRNRIMFPIRDARGRTIAFGGRVLGDDKPKYLNSPETDTFHKGRELYGLYEARKLTQKLERIVIVEGYMDVISLAQFGVTYAVATLGTATSQQHLERLFKTVSEVVFCFDGDKAGRKAAERALETTLTSIKDGQEARFLFLPEGEDPDTLIRAEGKDGFEKRLNEALPLSEFFFKSHSQGSDMTSIDGRARFSSEALPMLQQMQPGLLKQMMIDKICEITGLTLEQINSTIQLVPTSASNSAHNDSSYDNSYYEDATPNNFTPRDNNYPERRSTKPSPKEPSRPTSSLCGHLVSLLLHHPELAPLATEYDSLSDLHEPHSELLQAFLQYLHTHPNTSLHTLLIDWRDDEDLSKHLLQLSGISHLDPILNGNPKQLFSDAWKRLTRRLQVNELQKLQKKPLATLSQPEKQRLSELLTLSRQ
ncbi:DNA primase [Neptunomonas phycophila]|uniref:DNA primase n=1 Tax=Neptunomonas phycophila TaxID=1572645 RepID=UPI003736A909